MDAEHTVWVARPADVIWPNDRVDELATRIGGAALYPADCSPPNSKIITCSTCKKELALVLQAHAPLTSEQVCTEQAARFLYIFGCTGEGCSKLPGNWRALRFVPPAGASGDAVAAASNVEPAEPASAHGMEVTAVTAAAATQPTAADEWGLGSEDDDWGMGEEQKGELGGGSSSGSHCGPATLPEVFAFGDLNAALEAMGAAAASAAAATPASKPGTAAPAAATIATPVCSAASRPVYDAHRPVLPAFYLCAEPEGRNPDGRRQQPAPHAQQQQQHVLRLIEQYEAEIEGSMTAAGEPAPAGRSTSCAAVCGQTDSASMAGWGGEEYEEDAVLAPAGGKRPELDAAFFKFSKRLEWCPDQCARYSFGGAPLWPLREAPPEPVPCKHCGAQRVFELQLMSPVMPALSETAEWIAAQDPTVHLLQPDSWEWLTICVYVCGSSCSNSSGLVEECIILANE